MRRLLLLLLLLAPAAHGWPRDVAREGAANHARVLAEHGGALPDPALVDYVQRIGQALVAVSDKPGESWTFTVLDTPVVNAFALPGGYVYVTRGLLALANSEAELAGVLGHEIAHVTRNHIDARRERSRNAGIGVIAGTVIGGILDGREGLRKGIELSSTVARGYVAQYSQKQEFEADQHGQYLMTAAGYDPLAQALFLGAMGRKAALDAELAGREYNPDRMQIFASHPATGQRVRRAESLARKSELRALLAVGEAPYMAAIDGLVYGDSRAQGLVRGRSFSHPGLRFAFSVPQGFHIANSATSVDAEGPADARFTLSPGGRAQGSATAHITRTWLPALQRQSRTGALRDLAEIEANGLTRAEAVLPLVRGGRDSLALLHVVSHGGRFYRLTGLVPADRPDLLADLRAAARSFRPLSAAEADALTPWRIETRSARPGDTPESLTRGRPFGARPVDRFLVLNNLAAPADLQPGDIVKLIAE